MEIELQGDEDDEEEDDNNKKKANAEASDLFAEDPDTGEADPFA